MADPSGTDLVSGTTDGDTLPEFPAYEDRLITLDSSVALTGGVQYAIVVRAVDAPINNDVFWHRKAAGTKTGGSHMTSVNSGVTWSDLDPADAWFQTFYNSTYRDQYAPTTDGVSGTIIGVAWKAQTYTAFGTYSINKIKLRLSREVGASPGTITVGLQATGVAKATNPTPENDSTIVDFSDFTLSWEDGGGATSYDVYIGPSGSLTKVSSEQVDTSYITTLSELETIFGVSPINQKIYWRIDSNGDSGTTTGDEWNFDARPDAVTVTTPTNEAADITLASTTGSWTAATNATSYDVYFGTVSGSTEYVGNVSAVSSVLVGSPFSYGVTYYWKVVARNQFGTTDSAEFWFVSIVFDQLAVSYRLLDGGSGSGPYDSPPGTEGTDWEWTGENTMITYKRLVAAANNTIWYET